MHELPKRRILVHKAVEPRNLSAKTRDAVNAATRRWQVKFDGVFCMIRLDKGKAVAYSRTGEVVNGSMNHCLRLLEKFLPDRSGWFFGEAWHRDWTHQKINGTFRRGADGSELEFVFFDYVPLEDFERGHCDVPYTSRQFVGSQLIYIAMMGAVDSGNADKQPLFVAGLYADKVLAVDEVEGHRRHGHEYAIDGFMSKDPLGHWVAGAGLGGEVVKDKDHVSVDVKVVGIFEGKGKFAGMLGGLTIVYKGQEQNCGGGKLTDKERKALWADPWKIVGKIVEVHGLSESEGGLLREPRYIRMREDKTEGE